MLPDDIAENLSATERTFFQGYSDALGSYMNDINLDLTVVSSFDPSIVLQGLSRFLCASFSQIRMFELLVDYVSFTTFSDVIIHLL